MSEADESVKSSCKEPLFCVEWTAAVPSDEYAESIGPYFHFASIQCQLRLARVGRSDLKLCVISDDVGDMEEITECFRCTIIPVSEVDVKFPPPPLRKRIHPSEIFLYEFYLSDYDLKRILGKTISFLVVLEEDDGLSTQEQEDEKSMHQASFCIDPIPCSESLSEDLAKLQVSDSNPDVVESLCEGQSTEAHGPVESARSPVLAQMIEDMTIKDPTTGIPMIGAMDRDTLRRCEKYLSTGRVDEAVTFEAAVALYEAASKYGLVKLAAGCAQCLFGGLTVENACGLLVKADALGDQEVVEKVTDFILENKMPILEDEPWSLFSDNHPMLANNVYRRLCRMTFK